MSDELLKLCLKITGTFENGTPQYDGLTGDFDGQGMSVGLLQWNAGQGTMQSLVKTIASRMGWDKAQSFFKSSLQEFANSNPTEAIAFCHTHYLVDSGRSVSDAGVRAWKAFLSQPESVEVQNALATDEMLNPAIKLAEEFCPEDSKSNRVIVFFFDVKVQEGSMRTVRPVPKGSVTANAAVAYAHANSEENAALWEAASASDPLTTQLLYYGYERALLGNPTYVWDAFSRRATIAARKGVVHGQKMDFTSLLD